MAEDTKEVIDAIGELAKTPEQKVLEPWGHVNFEGANGLVHNNCRVMCFTSADDMNRWFKEHSGYWCAQVNVSATDLVCIVEKILTEEERIFLEEHGAAINEIRERKKAEREAAEEKQKEAEDKRLAELDDLIALGKKCQHDHGGVIADNAKLKKEVKDLKKKAGK